MERRAFMGAVAGLATGGAVLDRDSTGTAPEPEPEPEPDDGWGGRCTRGCWHHDGAWSNHTATGECPYHRENPVRPMATYCGPWCGCENNTSMTVTGTLTFSAESVTVT